MDRVVAGVISSQLLELEHFAFLHGLEAKSLPRALVVQVTVRVVHVEEACGSCPVQLRPWLYQQTYW